MRTVAVRVRSPRDSAAKNNQKVKTNWGTPEGWVGTVIFPRQGAVFSTFSFYLEFHYRYDTPGQDDLNHNGRYTSAQSLFLHGNKMSSSCKYISCMTLSMMSPV